MVGKTNVAGARLRSVISVTYPEGSVCTCSNGTKTLKARDTSGKALFNVSTGTWTVTATDGNKTKDATVDITTDGQSKSVTLGYELVLVDNGSMNTDLTGDWTITKTNTWDSTGTPTITKESDHVYIYTSYGADVAVSHRTAIDLTNCNTLSINISAFQTRGTSIKVGIGTNNNDSALAVASGTLTTDGEARTITLDVSSLTGNYYFKAVSGEQITIRIYDLRIT